jgi:hypothetical protein
LRSSPRSSVDTGKGERGFHRGATARRQYPIIS